MKHSLTVKTGIITSASVLRMAGVMAINMILARTLSRTMYGTYQQVWLVYSSAFPVFMLGIPVALYYFLQHVDEKNKGSLMANSSLMLFISGLVLAAGMALGAGRIAKLLGNQDMIVPLRIFSAYALFSVSTLWAEPFYISTERHKVVLFVSGASAVGLFASVVPLARAASPLSMVFVAVVIYSGLRFATLAFMLGRDRTLPRRTLSASLARKQLTYSIPVGASEMVASVSRNIDKLVVSKFFNPASYAIYSNGAVEIPALGLLLGSISSVILPSLSRMHQENRKQDFLSAWSNAVDKTAFFVMPLFFFFLLYAPDFMITLFSQRYVESALPFRVYLLVLPVRVAQYGVLLLALGVTRPLFYGALGDLVLNLALSIALVRPLGYVGPALATVCTTWLEVLYYLAVAKGKLGTGFRSILPWGRIGRSFTLAAFACGLSYPVRISPVNPLLRLIAGGLAFAAAYLLLSYWFAKDSMPGILTGRGES
jgi:O-antigen/teichoic acid export membrane protein